MDAISKFQVSRGGNVYSFCGKSIFSSDNQKFTVVNKSGKLLFEYVSPTNQQGIMLLLSRISFAVFCFLTTILICKKQKWTPRFTVVAGSHIIESLVPLPSKVSQMTPPTQFPTSSDFDLAFSIANELDDYYIDSVVRYPHASYCVTTSART